MLGSCFRLDIRFTKDNVYDLTADAIIHFSGCNFFGKENKNLIERAGDEILESFTKHGACSVGDAKVVPGFNLKADYVIMTVILVEVKDETDKQLFVKAVRKAFEIIKEFSVRIIAIDIAKLKELYEDNYVNLFNEVIRDREFKNLELIIYMST